MPDTQHRENDGRPLGMSSNANPEAQSEATALRCAIEESIAALESLSALLATAEHALAHAGGGQEHRPPASGDAVAAGMPSRVSARRWRRAVPRWPARRPRACAVCGREAASQSKRELSQAGWTITGRQAICAQCGSTGWRLAEPGGLPFRPR